MTELPTVFIAMATDRSGQRIVSVHGSLQSAMSEHPGDWHAESDGTGWWKSATDDHDPNAIVMRVVLP